MTGGKPLPYHDQESYSGHEKQGPQVHCQQWGSHQRLMVNIHLSCSKRKFVQMQFTRGNRKGINLYEPFFMYIVENLGIKNSDAD